jgi:hypothetical protein
MTKLTVALRNFSNVPKRPLLSVVPITNTFRDLKLIIFQVPVSVIRCVCVFVCLFVCMRARAHACVCVCVCV